MKETQYEGDIIQNLVEAVSLLGDGLKEFIISRNVYPLIVKDLHDYLVFNKNEDMYMVPFGFAMKIDEESENEARLINIHTKKTIKITGIEKK